MICPKCGDGNDDALKFCARCGYNLQSHFRSQTAPPGHCAPPMEAYFKALIGPKNQDYYLKRFLSFEERGKPGPTWHWPSCFFTLLWLLYRKMWLNAFFYWLLPLIVFIPALIVTAVLGSSGKIFFGAIYLLYLAAIFFVLPLFANALYYRHCKKQITEAQASGNDTQWQMGALTGKGGTSSGVAIFAAVMIIIAFIGILAAIAIPNFIMFKNRAALVLASQAGRDATQYVTQYYRQYQKIPASIQEAGMIAPLPAAVSHIAVDGQNGTIVVTLKDSYFEGKALLFIPTQASDQEITWTCMGQNIEDRFLPTSCRSRKDGN